MKKTGILLDNILIKEITAKIRTPLSTLVLPFRNVFTPRKMIAIVYKINKWSNEI